MTRHDFEFSINDAISQNRTTIKDIEDVEGWLTTQTYPKLTKEQIVAFLLSCHNDKSWAKNTIAANFALKSNRPDLFTDRTLRNVSIQKILNVVHIGVMPVRLNGSVIVVSQMVDTDYHNFDLIAYTKFILMGMETATLKADPPDGLIAILDSKGFGLMHLTCVKLDLVKWLLQYIQEGMPIKVTAVHIINTNTASEMALNLAKPFIKNEIKKTLHVHSTSHMELFYQNHIPKRYLPSDIGGELEPLKTYREISLRNMDKMEEYFKFEEQQRAAAAK
uniref:CRAL-TRIO domain-containing protein n=2 Tax=Photinus pyralis TaxID=7054 RepID=A0A1Y1LW68_PHOPY